MGIYGNHLRSQIRFGFPIGRSLSNLESCKATGVENRSQMSHVLTHAIIRGGISEFLSGFYEFG